MTDEPEVRFVCTNRGGHPSRELAVLMLPDDPPDDMTFEEMCKAWPDADDPHEAMREYRDAALVVVHRRNRRGETVDSQSSISDYSREGAGRFRLTCPSCRRDLPLALPNAKRIVRAAVAAGMLAIDISAL